MRTNEEVQDRINSIKEQLTQTIILSATHPEPRQRIKQDNIRILLLHELYILEWIQGRDKDMFIEYQLKNITIPLDINP
jgi:hypothetical protein